MRMVFRFVRRLFSSAIFLVFIGMFALNIASLTVPDVHAMVSQALQTTLGLRSIGAADPRDRALLQKRSAGLAAENRKLKVELVASTARNAALMSQVKKTTGSVKRRTAKVAATNLSSAAGQSIPFLGIAVIVAATGYELHSACATMRDMDALETALNGKDKADPDTDVVCGMTVPTKEELWASVKNSPSGAWSLAKQGFEQVSELSIDLPDTEFASGWQDSLGGWTDRLFGSE